MKEQILALAVQSGFKRDWAILNCTGQFESFYHAAIESYKAKLLDEVGEPVAVYDGKKFYANETSAYCGCADLMNLQKIHTSDQVAAAVLKATKSLEDQLAKGNEPRAFLHEWIEYHPFGDTVAGEPFATITNDEKPFDSSDTVSPLFTFPPTAEQIANETAEAIASFVDTTATYDTSKEIAGAIRSGAWKEFKK